jgi:poly(hydroxyalkanoate) depolymerase family esterase
MTGLNLPGPDLPGPKAPAIRLPDGAAFRSESYRGRTGSRDYRHYVPASAGDGVGGIVLMLHGCTQSPEDFAVGTKMNALAEAHRLVVIYPEQARGANAQTCWNWFSTGDQRRDRGEPDILAGIARTAMAEHGVAADRVFVAGLSAGAAMAVILGETYPDVFAAVGAHSGLPFGAARDVPSAFAAMAGNRQAATEAAPASAIRRSIVFHGAADRTVHPSNGDEIARRAGNAPGRSAIQSTETGERGGRRFRRSLSTDASGQVLSEHWLIDGLGHAWSGGDGAGSYADPAGPDASAEMIRFFLDLPPEDPR